MWGELHESKQFDLPLSRVVSAGTGNRLFGELGATLHYDVYSFPAESAEHWQSQELLVVTLLRDGREVDAQEDFDSVVLEYLFATRPSADQRRAIELVERVASTFGGEAHYRGEVVSVERVLSDWDDCNSYLLREWGEEPGSKELRRMLEENVDFSENR